MGLDTASVYDNEKEVGRAVVDSGVGRKNLFIQTKVWRRFVGPAKNGKPKCDAELRKSLKKLGVKMVDLWLMHWTGPRCILMAKGQDGARELEPCHEAGDLQRDGQI